MKHREKRFESKYKPSRLLNFMSSVVVIIVVLLWIFHEKIGVTIPDLMIVTGIAVLIIDLAWMNRKKFKNLKIDESHLKKNQDKIGNGDYNNDIYYDK